MLPNVLIGIGLYFVLAVGAAVLVLVPSVRHMASRAVVQRVQRVRAVGATGLVSMWPRGMSLRAAAQPFAAMPGPVLRRRAGAVMAALTVLLGVPAAVVVLRNANPPETYDHRALRPSDPRVGALLRGEDLVPPPALPPELFMQQEVERVHPMVRSANREWALLDAEFRQRLLVVFQVMKERHGIEAVLLEGYRSPERQSQLQALGPSVTRAGAFESYHQHGLAADVAFLRDGRIVISERDPWAQQAYALMGETADGLGLVWGGHWRSLKDYGHLELRRPGVLRRIPPAGNAPTPAGG